MGFLVLPGRLGQLARDGGREECKVWGFICRFPVFGLSMVWLHPSIELRNSCQGASCAGLSLQVPGAPSSCTCSGLGWYQHLLLLGPQGALWASAFSLVVSPSPATPLKTVLLLNVFQITPSACATCSAGPRTDQRPNSNPGLQSPIISRTYSIPREIMSGA